MGGAIADVGPEDTAFAQRSAPYLNFTGRADEAPSAGVDSAYGRNLQRLAQVKQTYDPDNFFNLSDNIKPAPALERGY
jgi:hypothetical protein